MANTRRLLKGRVSVSGRWYGPGPVDDDIAAKITNPKAWVSDDDVDDEVAAVYDRVSGTSTGARLARRVNIGGRWYGPDSEIPDDIAAKITNPKAWEGGKLPALYDNGGELPAGEVKWAGGEGKAPAAAEAPAAAAEAGETPDAKAPKKAATKK